MTSGAEDGRVVISAFKTGAEANVITYTVGATTYIADATNVTINTDLDTGAMLMRGGNAGNASITLFGPSHGSTPAVALTTGVARWTQNSTDTPGSGNNTVGGALATNGALSVNTSATHVIGKTADGTNVVINSGGTAQGTISIAGATTTYGAFFGSHWSQLADGSKPDILRGTICESIDEMCEWPDAGTDDRLPRFKVSDTPGSKSVYGVFAWWDDYQDDITNDAFIGSLGAFMVRMAMGQTVQRGDYIESNGDGCGRVQKDDILRSSTVAKITSTTIAEVYPDGSYLVPCTLHCG